MNDMERILLLMLNVDEQKKAYEMGKQLGTFASSMKRGLMDGGLSEEEAFDIVLITVEKSC